MALATPTHNYEKLKEQLIIDQKRLDDCLMKQPQLFSDAADSYAEAASFRDRSKQSLEECDADIAQQFRSSAIEKTTEAKITEHVTNHPTHKEYTQVFLHYKAMADHWLGLVKAYEQRVQMLRSLITIHNQGYFGSGLQNDSEYSDALAAEMNARKARDGAA